MILKIELENFFSIRDKVRIDFRAGNINTTYSRKLKQNVMKWKGVTILKSVGLFGPNASGKSNILKAINFCCRLVLDSHLYNEGATFDYLPFKFEGYDKKPSKFLIDFVCDDVEYEYSFELIANTVVCESLYHYPMGRRAKVFVRKDGEYSFGSGVMAKPSDVVLNTSSKNLFLSRASSMNREIAQRLYRYFFQQFLLGLVSINDFVVLDSFNRYRQLILKALEICDSDITDIEVRKEQMPAPVRLSGQSEYTYQMVDILHFKTFHHNNKDIMFDMDMEESNGTKKLFQILIRLIDVVTNNKSIMMDEFDMGLHTRLADFILDLIHASEGSQLLFSSHNTSLLDTKRLRKDQIVFVNKTEDGTTMVYSLYDYKDFRENMDTEKGYRQGRFDAVPYVNYTVSDIKQLLKS